MSDEPWRSEFNVAQHFTLLGQAQRAIARAFSYGGAMTVSALTWEMAASGWRDDETHVCLGALAEMGWVVLVAPKSTEEVVLLPADSYPFERIRVDYSTRPDPTMGAETDPTMEQNQ